MIGAVISPTDPVIASSLVKGKFAEEHIPARIRDLLSAESSANDGAAFPFVSLALLFVSVRNQCDESNSFSLGND